MVKESDAQYQIERLAQLERYPKWQGEERALGELMAVAQKAPSLQLLREVIDTIVHTSTECPKPSELLNALRPRELYEGPASTDCTLCDGTGWRIVWTLHTVTGNQPWRLANRENVSPDVAQQIADKLPRTQRLHSGATRCSCRPMQEAS